MKNFISSILNFFNSEKAIKSGIHTSKLGEDGFRDYLKSNIIKDSILSEILKTDLVRIKIISILIQKLTVEIEDLANRGQSVENIRSLNHLKGSLLKNERRLKKLTNRSQPTQQNNTKDSNELLLQISKLRTYIDEEKIDLYFNEIKKIDSIEDLYIEKTLLEARFNKLEMDNRRKLISTLNYSIEKTEIFLELLNFVDEIYERNN